MILRKCWEGRTYDEIAVSSRYTPDYIRVAGSQLWQMLSEATGAKVTKHNLRSSLIRWQHNQTQTLKHEFQPYTGEVPEGPVPLESQFYIERLPLEGRCREELAKPGSLIRIKAPGQWGKTSMMMRLLTHAKSLDYQIVRLNFQQIDWTLLSDLNRFMRWFCVYLTQQLQLETKLDDYWDADLGSKVSCTNYLQYYLLPQLQSNFLLAIDEMHRIFEASAVARDFLPLLRFWYEEAKQQEIWKKLRIIVAYSTETFIPLNLNQSPFNVGLPAILPEFSLEQIAELARRYGIEWMSNETKTKDLTALQNITQGHPYLVRLALYKLAQKEVSFGRLIQEATTEAGIYSDYLRSRLIILQTQPELGQAFKKIAAIDHPTTIEPLLAYKLSSLGLVKHLGNEVLPSCELYRFYFRDRLR
ncbi:AAA-like domain-containing protein [Oscillatoria sp. FACHB-1407]|nr:AAA-like domain-containing protein [Oscillatoria sp. FACHB-1407]